MTLRILITGGKGQVGLACKAIGWPDDVTLLFPDRDVLDLTNPSSIGDALAGLSPDVIVNCAAYTAVDRAESDRECAWAVNALGPCEIARYGRTQQVPVIQVSTDYVFGDGQGFRSENDAPAPTSVYGASKLGGEIAVAAASDRNIIVRTAWVVSPWRQNFVKTMMRLATQRDEIAVVGDQIGCPTSATDIAAALQTIALRAAEGKDAPPGIYHFVNAGEATWAQLAEETMKHAAACGLPSAKIVAISSSEYPTPVKRPADSRLSTQRIRRDFGIAPRDWRPAIRDIISAIAEEEEFSA